MPAEPERRFEVHTCNGKEVGRYKLTQRSDGSWINEDQEKFKAEENARMLGHIEAVYGERMNP